MKISCSRCGYNEIQKDLHLHHLVPIGLGGEDAHGRKWLCKKCHDILHNMIPSQIWKFIPEDKKEQARNSLKGFSLWWIGK